MAKKEKPKSSSQNVFDGDIDDSVIQRVNKMMGDEPPAKPDKVAADSESAGAPLLPTEKLPEPVKKLVEAQPNQPKDTEKVSPQEPDRELEKPDKDFDRDNIGLEDPKTEKIVDEIANEESDRLLAIEDAKAELLNDGDAVISESLLTRLRSKLSDIWSHKSVRWLSILILFAAIAAAAIVPASRYFLLNTAGVRASTSMTILDDKTKQPLKDVEVMLQDKAEKSDIEGRVSFANVKLGNSEVVIKKPAFASVAKQVTLGWGSNPIGEVGLTAIGSRYTFNLVDFVSGKPIAHAEATSGSASAVSDDKGTLVLVVEDQNSPSVEINIKAENYRVEKVKLPIGDKQAHNIALVPARKHAFISKRDGTFDLFTTDIDGKNLKKILPGTGSERESTLLLLSHPTKDIAALVSTRGNHYDKKGNLLNVLNMVDLSDGSATEISRSASLQLLGFAGDSLVYISEVENASEDDPNRFVLVSYDVSSGDRKKLAASNYFNDAIIANGSVYYSPTSGTKKTSGLFKVEPNGSNATTILQTEAWNIFRVSYDKLHIALAKDWYEYDLNTSLLSKLEGAPATNKSRYFESSPDGKRAIWTDERDGKGVLLLNDLAGKDKTLQTAAGLSNPVRWLDNDHIIYRIKNTSETADYVISLSGGEPKKIQDVTDTLGLDRLYIF